MRPLLARHTDGTLTDSERALLAAHLAACPECRASVAAVTRMGGLLRARVPAAPEPSADLWSRIQAEMTMDAARRSVPIAPPRTPFRLRLAFAIPGAAFAAASAFAFFSGALSSHPVAVPAVAWNEKAASASKAEPTNEGATGAKAAPGAGLSLEAARTDASRPSAPSPVVGRMAKEERRAVIAGAPAKSPATEADAPDPFTPLANRHPLGAPARAPQVAWGAAPPSSRIAAARRAHVASSAGGRGRATNVAKSVPSATLAANAPVTTVASASGSPLPAAEIAPRAPESIIVTNRDDALSPVVTATSAAPAGVSSDASASLAMKSAEARADTAATNELNSIAATRGVRPGGNATEAPRSARAIVDQNGYRVTAGGRGQALGVGNTTSSPLAASSIPNNKGRLTAATSAPSSAVDMATQIRRQRSLFQYAGPQH